MQETNNLGSRQAAVDTKYNEVKDIKIKRISNSHVQTELTFLDDFREIPDFKLEFYGLERPLINKIKDYLFKKVPDLEILSQGTIIQGACESETKNITYKSLKNTLLVRVFDSDSIEIFSKKPIEDEFVNPIKNIINEFNKQNVNNSVFILSFDQDRGLYLENFKINDKFKSLNLEDNYNSDFSEFDEKFLDRLHKNEVGLYLLHGQPGTGKTTYLRNLIRKTSKRVIFVPPLLANRFSDPNMIPFLMKYPDSIIIIEDAENIITKRTKGDNQSVSNLLNITDGILGDCLKFQTICTFNTPKEQIDDALLREGRLILRYEFEKLSVEKSNQLLEKLNSKKTNTPLSLSEIYNRGENNQQFTKEESKIGF